MSWFTENKFTAVFGGITVVAAGALGWLVLGAKGELEAKQSEFTDLTGKLTSLQTGKPFPNDKNAAAYKLEFARVEAELVKMHQRLLSTELPLEDVRPNAFQERLKQTVDKVKVESLAKKMLLPGQKKDDASAVAADTTFNLGFDYLSNQPQDEASSELARQLKTVDFVIQQLLANGATELLEIKREPLAVEKGDKAAKKDEKKPAVGAAKGNTDDGPKLVVRNKFDVKFVASQASFMKILNAITSAPQPFIIPRRVNVKNEKTEGPSKEVAVLNVPADAPPADPNAPATPVSPAPATPAVPTTPAAPATPGAVAAPSEPTEAKGPAKINWIVGEEKLVIELELEMVDFADAKVEADAKAKTSK